MARLAYLLSLPCIGLLAVLLLMPDPGTETSFDPSGKPWKSWRPGDVPRGDGPGMKPDDWFLRQRAYPYPDIPEPARLDGMREARALQTLQALGTTDWVGTWQPAGPTNVHGRITSIAVHPSAPNTVYIGTPNGGVFKSIDGGVNWTPIFDHAPSLAIGAVAIDPGDPNTVYVGTGEANAAGDTYSGDGVWRSTDGGSTWEHLGLEQSAKIGRIVIDPTDPDRIFVAVMGRLFSPNPHRGLYRSENGGQTWTKVLFVNIITGITGAIDVVINPSDPDEMYAATWERIRSDSTRQVGGFGSGIHRSVDGGTNWALLANGLPAPGADNGRIGLALAPSNPSTVYAYMINHPGTLMGIYRTTDAGANWARVDNGSDINDVTSSFGWYFGQIRVDPADADRIFVLGVPLYRSSNGGSSWMEVGGSMHVDHHAMWIDPGDPNHIYVGNDGGFHVSTNGGGTWTKKGELPITQFYAITVDEQLPERLYGGTQDNSTVRTKTGDTSGWGVIYFGDGFYTLVDPRDSKVIYAEYQFGGLGKTTNTGNSWTTVLDGIPGGDRRNWSTPVVMDPTDPDVLYYGTYRVFKTTNGAGLWAPISGDLTEGEHPGNLGLGTITTIDVATTDSAAVIAGTDDGNVWMTYDGGSNWTRVSETFPDRWITRVAFDPTDHLTAYVTLSGYRLDEFLPHIFRTENAGATWQDISSNLPPIPLNDVIVDPEDADILYVGADAGVYWSADRGATWQVLGQGLPNTPVHDLHLHQGTRTLVAGTHGRSMFTYQLGQVIGVEETDRPPSIGVLASPNPTRGATTIAFDLDRGQEILLEVFDLQGRRVRTLAEGDFPAGRHEVRWDGNDHQGLRVAAGTYFYRIQTDRTRKAGKIVVLR